MRSVSTVFALVMLAAFGLLVSTVHACPFCSAPSLTLSEQLAQSDAVALVQWVKGTRPKGQTPGSTTFEIVRLEKNPSNVLEKSQRITLNRYRAGDPGELFLLTGTVTGQDVKIEWSSPLEVTETSFNYIAGAPLPEAPTQERLAYFVKFLEYPDRLVADDAYAEFANAPYKHIAPLAPILPREKLREWVTSDDVPQTRLGLYGLMLGLCGKPEDAELMEAKISETTEDFRIGIDGVMSGYLLLKGEQGLDVIEEAKLQNKDVPFSETYAAMQALRFLWTYAEGHIDKDRLRHSMRTLLDRPELADLVIADLARWEDWSVQDRLMELYGADEYNIPSIKRAIVRYMLQSTKYKGAGDNAEPPERVKKGKQLLAQLREKDPKTVKEAERFFSF